MYKGSCRWGVSVIGRYSTCYHLVLTVYTGTVVLWKQYGRVESLCTAVHSIYLLPVLLVDESSSDLEGSCDQTIVCSPLV